MIKIVNRPMFFREKTSMFIDTLEINGGQYIQIDFSTVTLGIDGIRLFVKNFPIDRSGNIVPILTNHNYKGLEVSGHTIVEANRRITIDGGHLGNLYKGYQWIITKPPQVAVNSNSAGFFINIHYDPI